MIQAGQCDSYNTPPDMQLIRGCPVPAKPKKESVVDIIAGAATADVKAIQQGSPASRDTSTSAGKFQLFHATHTHTYRCMHSHAHTHTHTHTCPVLLFSCRYGHATPVRGSKGNGWIMERTWMMSNVRSTSVDRLGTMPGAPALVLESRLPNQA